MKKKIIWLGIIILVIALAVGGWFYFSDKAEDKEDNNTYLVLEINPKLMLSLNEDGKIIEVFHLNDDASIFINDALKGLDLNKAIDKVVEVAQSNGYLKDNKNITISALDNNDKYLNQAKEQLEKKDIIVKKEVLSSDEEKELKDTYIDKKENKEDDTKEENDLICTSSENKLENASEVYTYKFKAENNKPIEIYYGFDTVFNSSDKAQEFYQTYLDGYKDYNYIKVSKSGNKVTIGMTLTKAIADENQAELFNLNINDINAIKEKIAFGGLTWSCQ